MKAKEQTVFVCKNCGNEFSKWAGKCPACSEWNSLVETTAFAKPTTAAQKRSHSKIEPVKLDFKTEKPAERMLIGIGELDLAIGGGIVPGQVILVAGEPGIGKSTLLLQVAARVTDKRHGSTDLSVLYICGEESPEQVGLRAQRLGILKIDGLVLYPGTDVDQVIEFVEQSYKTSGFKPGLLVVDSIQTMTTADLPGTAGSVTQVRECAFRLVRMAKEKGIAIFIVGHVTKDGDIAGPRVLEHMVDTVLWFEGERSQNLRIVRTIKNRFGSTDEVGIFKMTDKGLTEVTNPSEYLLEERVVGVPGSVVSVILEGKRPMMVEVQALTVPTQFPVPRRVASGVDFNRLQMLCAVLTRRAGIDLSTFDVFVNVAGGVKVADPGLDLAICLSIASSLKNKAVDRYVAGVGEVGLLGEVRKVSELDKRIKEAKKMGYKVASAESGKMLGAAIEKMVGR